MGSAKGGKGTALKTRRFKAFVDRIKPPLPKTLPLVHMTDAYGARSILATGFIEPKTCRHFTALLGKDEPLSFFFYGRAGYRPRGGSPTKNNAKLPIAIVIDFDVSIHPVKRIFPFDTGACFAGLYSQFLHDQMGPMDFCLENDIEVAQKNVAAFFKTNEKYVNDKPSAEIECDSAEFEVSSFHNLLRNTADLPVDNRKSSIEVQFDKPIDLKKSRMHGVVMPEVLIDSEDFKSLIGGFSTRSIPYVMSGGSTTEYDGILIAESTKLLRGLL